MNGDWRRTGSAHSMRAISAPSPISLTSSKLGYYYEINLIKVLSKQIGGQKIYHIVRNIGINFILI